MGTDASFRSKTGENGDSSAPSRRLPRHSGAPDPRPGPKTRGGTLARDGPGASARIGVGGDPADETAARRGRGADRRRHCAGDHGPAAMGRRGRRRCRRPAGGVGSAGAPGPPAGRPVPGLGGGPGLRRLPALGGGAGAPHRRPGHRGRGRRGARGQLHRRLRAGPGPGPGVPGGGQRPGPGGAVRAGGPWPAGAGMAPGNPRRGARDLGPGDRRARQPGGEAGARVTEIPAVRAAPPEDDERETLGQRLAWHLYTSMERIAMGWPERPARLLFEGYARAGYRLMRKARATVSKNYGQVLGRPPGSDLVQAAVREGFSLYARYWYESFAVRTWDRDRVDRTFHIQIAERLDKALAAGRGCIAALPHLGNWDVAGKWLAGHYKMVAVAEQLKPRRMYELFLQHRLDLGMEIVPLTEDRSAGIQLAQMLADNYVVTLVADRDLGGRGVDCEMFGRTRKVPAGPALLSLSTGAPLLACSTYTADDGWLCHIGEPLEIERTGEMRADVTALTRLLAAEFERAIAARPTDWHMFQPAWGDGDGAAAVPGAPPAAGPPAPG